jgi:phosphoglucosamine mutase
MIQKKLFGTDGIRGLANSPTMNTDIAVAVGRAAAYFVRASDELPRIVIGKDTRLSGYMIESALASGITSMGIDVLKTGPLPSPGVGFICRTMRSRLGIVISASHNPAEENGIKIFGQDGFKLDADQEALLEKLIAEGVPEKHLAEANRIGKITQIDDSGGRYIQYLKECYPHRLTLRGMKIVVDCANGAAYKIAPSVLSELGADVVSAFDKPNGLNVNQDCGALHPEKLCDLTRMLNADLGVAFDGDADRVLLSDGDGHLIDGDGILYISAKHLHAKGTLQDSTVVGTVMTNSGLEVALREAGIALVRTDVGDHNVIAYMRQHGLNLGGEPCGHVVYLRHSPAGDGILTALRILSVMRQQGLSLRELLSGYTPFPQRTINVRIATKPDLLSVKDIAGVMAEVEAELKNEGRVILRYSGTSMLVRVTVEASDLARVEALAGKLADAVEKSIGV